MRSPVGGTGRAAPAEVEREDVQGLVVRAYGHLAAACYVLGELTDTARARAWLGALSGAVDDARERPGARAVNVALTPSGLRRLGLPDRTLQAFPNEFLEGMTEAHRRRLLGDVDESAPERWGWGGPLGDPLDVLLLLYARDEAELSAFAGEQRRAMEEGGVRIVRQLDTTPLEPREHFGFRDGVSQPRIEELGRAPYADSVRAGEFLLGYPNAYGRFTPRPLVPAAEDPGSMLAPDVEGSGAHDLGRNGSFLVFRQLSQDVHGFWDFCRRTAVAADGDDEGSSAAVRLAAKLIGRWPSGAPLVLAPDADRPELAEANDCPYHAEDRHGLRCPVGAHVRRANPRDSLDPSPGTRASVDVNKHHRLLRRGRQYGPFVPAEQLTGGAPPPDDGVARGLHFICLSANIARQFEFVQHTWLNNPRFAGLHGCPDPLGSPEPRGGRRFSVPREPVRERHAGLPRFVEVRGGAYFFLPGIRALRFLAALA